MVASTLASNEAPGKLLARGNLTCRSPCKMPDTSADVSGIVLYRVSLWSGHESLAADVRTMLGRGRRDTGGIFQTAYLYLTNATIVRIEHRETPAGEIGGFLTARHVAEALDHQTTDGVEFLIGEVGIEVLVEVIDGGQRADGELTIAQLANVLILIGVVLILDIPDDLLEDILDGDKACRAAVLVDDHRHGCGSRGIP